MKLAAIGASFALALFATGASALTLTSTNCDPNSLKIGGTPLACAGIFEGNDSNENLDGLFGFNDWIEVVKVDDPETVKAGGGITLTVTPAGGTSGDWSVSAWPAFENIMIALKSGSTFSVFLVDVTLGLAGTWNTDSLLNGNGGVGPALSHFTIYRSGDPTTVVPLPAAGWLLLSGIAGLGFASRRRKAG